MNTIREEDRAKAQEAVGTSIYFGDYEGLDADALIERVAQVIADARPVVTEDVREKAREIIQECHELDQPRCSHCCAPFSYEPLIDRIATALAAAQDSRDYWRGRYEALKAAQPSVDDAELTEIEARVSAYQIGNRSPELSKQFAADVPRLISRVREAEARIKELERGQ